MKTQLSRRLQVRGRAVRLAHWDPRSSPGCRNKEEAAERLARNLGRIDRQQYRLFAEARRSLLIVLHGMDTSGKDGLIRNVMTVFNPQGCRVWPFKRWKFSDAGPVERKHRRQYHRAYEEALSRCSTRQAPWDLIPADKKWYRNLAVCEILADAPEEVDPRLPRVKLEVKRLRARLLAT